MIYISWERRAVFLYLDIKAVTRDQERFYQALFNNYSDYIEIRLINKGNVKPIFLTYKELLSYPTPVDTNVYVGIYERSKKGNGTIENCIMTNAIYLDFDDMTLDEIRFRIDNSRIPLPSIIVNSGHGYHVYWLLDKPRGHEVKPIMDKLAELLKADPVATDQARILRVPDTMNVKGEPVPCKLVEINDNRATVKRFEEILGVKANVDLFVGTGSIKELLEINLNGLNNMAGGVKKGERNFCTGRIVQTLKRMNYTKQETSDVVFRWNNLNSPKERSNVLKKEINTFWHDDRYKYDGKEFSDTRLQELNSRFIDDDSTFLIGDETDTHNYDNELLNPVNFKKTKGLTFAILSIIKLAESKGIRREHLADLSRRNPNDKTLRESLILLEKMKYIKVVKKIRTNYYVFTEKGNYKRGYTSVSKSLHRSYIHGELKEHEYKLMILLESYAYDDKKEIFPSNQTLALRSGQSDRTIRRNLKQLEHKQFIKLEVKQGKQYIRFIYR